MRRLLPALGATAAAAAVALLAPDLPAPAPQAALPPGAVRYDRPGEFRRLHALLRLPDDARADALYDTTRSLPAVLPEAYPVGYQVRALDAALASASKTGPSLPWQDHGPGNVPGRARALVRDLRDPAGERWWLGTAGGGIWRTTTGGDAWRNATPDLPNLAFSALAQAPSSTATFYAGSGEGFGNSGAVSGAGVFKSTDGGTTWAVLPTTLTGNFRFVNRLVVSPVNADLVVAATQTGLMRTANGGATWARVQNVSGGVPQVVATPTFSALYATTRGQCGAQTNPFVLKSTDGGASWELASEGFAFPGGAGRVELAIAPTDPNRLYAAVEGCDGGSHLAVSADAGATWREVAFSNGTPFTLNWLGQQGWYGNAIAVHPFDANRVMLGGIDVWQADVSAAATAAPTARLTKVSDWAAAKTSPTYVHADIHGIVHHVTGPNTFSTWVTTDGGVSVSRTYGATWTLASGGLGTTQFYGASKRPGRLAFVGGAQDNGTHTSPEGAGATSVWTPRAGGDGFQAVYDADGSFIVSIYGNIVYRFNGAGTEYASAMDGLGDIGNDGPFVTVLAQNRARPERIFTVGASGVWRSDDFGRSWDLATLDGRYAGTTDLWGFNGLYTPAAVSVADARVVWAGARMSTRGALWLSRDAGATFQKTVTPAGTSGLLSGLATHPTDAATAFALFSTDGAAKILKTTDYGQTWASLTGTFAAGAATSSNGFPNVAVYSLLAMPYDPNVLWAGTEIGLFESTDGGASWRYANSGLPAVSIWQMDLIDGRVTLATHGRGIWSAAIPELAAYVPPPQRRTPGLTLATYGPTGEVRFEGVAREAFDSLVVRFDQLVVRRLGATTEGTTFAASLVPVVSQPRTSTVQATGYRDGVAYPSARRAVEVFPLDPAVETFADAFDGASAGQGFTSYGFSLARPAGFASRAIHSIHPYVSSAELVLTLQRPIRVEARNPVVRFREVALVEPGEDGAVWPAPEFYDYVVVEGTSDGATWRPLGAGYDARAHPEWAAAFAAGTPPTEALMKLRQVSLTPTFAPGETVFLRWRLYADGGVDGWGWAIDDLEVQPAVVAADAPAGPVATRLAPVYPNPLRAATASVRFTLDAPGPVHLALYDVLGRRLALLADGPLGAGEHTRTLDTGGLGAGLYYVRLSAGRTQQVQAVTVVR